jgi:hypothetical protein
MSELMYSQDEEQWDGIKKPMTEVLPIVIAGKN